MVLEGKYWKRKLDIVCVEYQKWRIFYKKKLMPKKKEKMGVSDVISLLVGRATPDFGKYLFHIFQENVRMIFKKK